MTIEYTPSVLNEEFNHPRGIWVDYDAYDASLREDIRGQKHIDIRDFYSSDESAPLSVLDLSKFLMSDLDGDDVNELDDSLHVLIPGEHWDSFGGTIQNDAILTDHNNWRALRAGGWGNYTIESATDPIDLLTDFEDDDYISLTLPDFPKNHLNLLLTKVSLTSHPDGEWSDPTLIATVAFNASINPLFAGNSEFRAYRSSFQQNNINLGAVTGVRLHVSGHNGTMPTNVITNPSFENEDAGWGTNTPTGVITFNVVPTTFGSGALAASIVTTGMLAGQETYINWAHTPVVAFDSIIAMAKVVVRSATTTVGTAFVRLRCYNAGFVGIGTYTGTGSQALPVTNTVNDLGLIVPLTSLPVGTAHVGIEVGVTMPSGGNVTFEVDNTMLLAEPGLFSSAMVYFDGDSPGFGWTGDPHDSTSTGPLVHYSALRLLSKDWQYSPVDMDTRRGKMVRTVSLDGDPASPYSFDQPIIWKSSEVPSENDPKPIDFNIATGFYTGSLDGTSSISIYGRELTEDFMQQLDLNGTVMATLDGHEQPDLGTAAFNPRLQTDLEPFAQDQLSGLTQFDLERTPDYLSASWIQYTVQWTSTSTQVSITNNEGDGYNFNLDDPLQPNASYVLIFELKDTAARAAIFPLGERGEIFFDAPIFDSTLIDDDFIYKRRKGRFGWHASLADGDAYIESIRFRSANYAEYRSLPYESLTPVIGAELLAEASPIIDLFTAFGPTDESVAVTRDQEVSASGESYRVTDYGVYTYQGLQSNRFEITDFDQTEMLLDVFYPSAVDPTATLEFYLQNQYDYLIALPRPKIFPDQWQSIRLRTPSTHLAQTGLYRLIVVQNKPVNLNWWVDNVRIFERTVSWHGRAVVEDPWAFTEDDWTPFQNSFNRDYGGILFQGRENKLQIKGVGHKQNATVTKVQFKPRYAELGRLVWPEEDLSDTYHAPTASYSTSNSSRLYTFNGFGSSDPDGRIINWYWTISDGSVYVGPIVQHLFGASGTYSVTLTVTDSNGLVHTVSANHSVA